MTVERCFAALDHPLKPVVLQLRDTTVAEVERDRVALQALLREWTAHSAPV